MNEVYLNLLKAGIAIVFILLIDFVIELLIVRKVKDNKKNIKLRVSLRYVLFFCFLFVMAKIWVDGFGYLLTVVGVIAAALTITQKEYLMNLVGWLIIMWRDLFVEGDYIEVGKYSGYVTNIGPLYFSIEEASDLLWGDKTGRTIKVPNSLIATNPIVNFTIEQAFVESKQAFIFSFKSSLEKIQALIPMIEQEIENTLNQCHTKWTLTQQREFTALKSQTLNHAQFSLRVFQDRPSGIQLKVRYLSLKQDQKIIEDAVFKVVMAFVQANSEALVLMVAT